MGEQANAFVEEFDLAPMGEGVLDGLRFAVKDLIDVAGRVTGSGNPTWAATHAPAARHAPSLTALLQAGGRCVGKTQTDELAYSLMGVNAHYGTPVNPAAPDRAPGGSSSGSASAVAAGSIDFAIGTDTGGSVRLPSSFCGIYGLRPTHGRVSLEGVTPLAESFDTLGWFAREPALLARVAEALGVEPQGPKPLSLSAPSDLWALAEPATAETLRPALAEVEALLGGADPAPLRGEGADYADLRQLFGVAQAHEAWTAHGAWIDAEAPNFGPGIKERFAAAKAVTEEQAAEARLARDQVKSAVRNMLDPEQVIAIPTSPAPAPLLDAGPADLDAFRGRALALLCVAGLAGLPQISMPMGLVDGAPVGLSLIGAPGADRALIDLAEQLGSRRR